MEKSRYRIAFEGVTNKCINLHDIVEDMIVLKELVEKEEAQPVMIYLDNDGTYTDDYGREREIIRQLECCPRCGKRIHRRLENQRCELCNQRINFDEKEYV